MAVQKQAVVELVQSHHREGRAVSEVLGSVGVARSSYYRWKKSQGQKNNPRHSWYELTAEVAARLLWKLEKAYSLGIPKNKLAHGVSQTEEEHAYARRYTIFGSKGRSFRARSVD